MLLPEPEWIRKGGVCQRSLEQLGIPRVFCGFFGLIATGSPGLLQLGVDHWSAAQWLSLVKKGHKNITQNLVFFLVRSEAS